MKKITLNFREVAVDGLPKEDLHIVLVVFHMGAIDTNFSVEHQAFNCLGMSDPETIAHRKIVWKPVRYWIPFDEFTAGLSEAKHDG